MKLILMNYLSSILLSLSLFFILTYIAFEHCFRWLLFFVVVDFHRSGQPLLTHPLPPSELIPVKQKKIGHRKGEDKWFDEW